MANLLTCPDAVIGFLGLFDFAIAPPLLFYSYIPIIAASLILSLFIFLKDKFSLPSKLLLAITVSFTFWAFDQIVQWVAIHAGVVHFAWELIAVFEMLVYIFSLYFVAVFINKKDINFRYKLLLGAVFLPTVLLLSTPWNMTSFDLQECQSNNGPLWAYIYLFEILSLVTMAYMFYQKFRSLPKTDSFRKQVAILGTGMLLFLGMFTATNIVGDSLLVYEFNLVGPIGMVAFVGLLAFMIVRFKAFNVKLIGAQALVMALIVLISSQFFFIQDATNRTLTAMTLVVTGIIGINLIRSVKKEIEQREMVESLAKTLDEANGKQEGLIHFIGHEVKGFLTKDAGTFASLMDGDFGVLPEPLKPLVEHALVESRQGADSVATILKASNLKKGTVSYEKAPFDLKATVAEAVEKARLVAEKKGLKLSFTAAEGNYQMTGDKAQIADHVLRNLIDNAVNYTPTGSIDVSLKNENKKLIFAVKDSGVGITDEDKKRLFTEGGHGADSVRVNVHSTGYGLYIAKQITEAHGGTIHAESAGAGKGSTFIVEFPD